MNKDKLLSIAEKLKTIAIELENEIKGDVGSYVFNSDEYAEILKYYDINDDDSEEGL